jgi:AAA domain
VPNKTEALFVGVALLAAGLFLLPLLGVAALASGLVFAVARTRREALVLLLLLGLAAGATAALVAWHAGLDLRAVALGYMAVQVQAGHTTLERAWSLPAARAYAAGIWPYALPGGLLCGGLLPIWAYAMHGIHAGATRGEQGTPRLPKPADAGKLAQQPPRRMAWCVPNVLGRGVVTLLSSPPGTGKGWALWALMRAMQDGERWFGLPAHRQRVLWCTEEGQSFEETARRFGIKPGLVEVIRREQLTADYDWPALVREIRRVAWQRRCALVIVDTIRAWCPQAERRPEDANAVMTSVRRELTKPGLGALFVHHDRKSGGEFGEGVAGTNALVGAVDVLIEFKRVPGQPQARRLVTSRRFDPLDVTATLQGVRYVMGTEPADGNADGNAAPPLPVPDHLRATLEALQARGEDGATAATLQGLLGGTQPTISRRLAALEALGLVIREGAGTKTAPTLWHVAGNNVPPVVTRVPAPPMSPAEYDAYRRTEHWAKVRLRALDAAGGVCQDCGQAAPVDVHHRTYERLWEEAPGDLVALCPSCHARRHRAA